jgi:hypothetical protein
LERKSRLQRKGEWGWHSLSILCGRTEELREEKPMQYLLWGVTVPQLKFQNLTKGQSNLTIYISFSLLIGRIKKMHLSFPIFSLRCAHTWTHA